MEYPKKAWRLYLKGVINEDGVNLSKYDGCIGIELSRDDTQALIKINDKMGYRKKNYPRETIKVPLNYLTLGYISKYHSDYLGESIIRLEENDYIKSMDKVWFLYSVFGYDLTLDTIIKNNGIIDNSTIEEIALIYGKNFYLYKVAHTLRNGYFLSPTDDSINWIPFKYEKKEIISALIALKRYGIEYMETSIEKTMCPISDEENSIALSKERDQKIDRIINI